MPIVSRNSPNQLSMAKWGFIPFWAHDSSIGWRMINARAESLSEKPSFRKSLHSQRCLVSANGFYEWKKLDERRKIPYQLKLANNKLFSFAGLYDVWPDPTGTKRKSYTIITTEPNDLLRPIHDRMPVILEEKDEDKWLDHSVSDIRKVLALLKPLSSKKMNAYSVARDVNSPKNNSKELIKPFSYQELNSKQDSLF